MCKDGAARASLKIAVCSSGDIDGGDGGGGVVVIVVVAILGGEVVS